MVQKWSNFEVVYEGLFLIAIIFNFFSEFYNPSTMKLEKEFKKIAFHYIRGSFFYDFIPLIPLRILLWGIKAKHRKLLYFSKLIRLRNGFKYLSHKVFMKGIKSTVHKRVAKIIESDPKLANSKVKDNNFVSLIILVSHIVKTFQLILTILCISYFFGIFWYVLCDLTTPKEETGLGDHFLYTFEVYGSDSSTSMVLLTYFAFTSLSTVGLGDLHPRSNIERLAGAFMLLFGVAITSYIMENFSDMILLFNKFSKTFEEESKLSLFFGTMERFNHEI